MDIVDALLFDTDSADSSNRDDDGVGQGLCTSGDPLSSIQMFDVDDDGQCETRVSRTDAGITVARDRDGDGVTDTFTSIRRGGDYETWEIFRAADGGGRWQRTDSGDVFD